MASVLEPFPLLQLGSSGSSPFQTPKAFQEDTALVSDHARALSTAHRVAVACTKANDTSDKPAAVASSSVIADAFSSAFGTPSKISDALPG